MARSRSSRLVRVLGVANAAGNLEVADLALVDAGDVPEVVLAPGGDSREALEVGSSYRTMSGRSPLPGVFVAPGDSRFENLSVVNTPPTLRK